MGEAAVSDLATKPSKDFQKGRTQARGRDSQLQPNRKGGFIKGTT
jgi:hypothetical protein